MHHPLHEKALTLSRDFKRTEAELLEVLSQMQKARLFLELGYASLFTYCEGALGLSRAQAYYFYSVANKAKEVPQLKAAVQSGELTLSQARRIVPIVNPNNAAEWIAKAQLLPQKELEWQVAQVNPQAKIQERIKVVTPEHAELKVTISVELEKKLRRLQDVLSQKFQRPVGIKEALEVAVEQGLEKLDPIRKAERFVSSGNKPKADSKPGRRPIPAQVLHQIRVRDKGQCTFVSVEGRRCGQTRWLNAHPIVEVADGGLNTVENLRTLCAQHHRAHHQAPPPGTEVAAS